MKMENKKSLILASLFLFAFLFSVMGVSATTTIVSPAASGTVGCGANTLFNVTSTDGVVPNRIVNLTFYAMSASTANNSWSIIATNNSLNLTLLANVTLTNINLTGLLEDSNDYIFNVTVKNQTGSIIGEDTNTGITVDCTAPTAPTLSPATNTQSPQTSSTTQTFTGTVTGSQVTSCTYIINRGGASSGSDYFSGSATHSGNTCTFTKAFTATTENGDWQWSITATDGTNSSTSSATFSVSLPAQSGGLPTNTDVNGNPVSPTQNTFWWIAGIIVVLIVVAVVLWQKN